MTQSRRRADEWIFEKGFSESRSKAQALIMAGEVEYRVLPDGPWQPIEKAGQPLKVETIEIRLIRTTPQDVGRGAQKLRRALELWPSVLQSANLALDIGASTGGFTQVLLEQGVKNVVALDVGTHQLHEKIRNDARVVVLEKQHILRTELADWTSFNVALPFDLLVTDLSFISVTKVIAHCAPWLRSGGSWIVLLKPQFELGPQKAPRGIVRNPEYHSEAIALLKKCVMQAKSLEWVAEAPSPILGGDGNKEFLVWLRKTVL